MNCLPDGSGSNREYPGSVLSLLILSASLTPDVGAPSQQCTLLSAPLCAALSFHQQKSWHTTLLHELSVYTPVELQQELLWTSGLLQLSRKEESLVNQVSCAEKVTPSYLRFSTISTISPWICSGRCHFLTLDLLKSISIPLDFDVLKSRSFSLHHIVS